VKSHVRFKPTRRIVASAGISLMLTLGAAAPAIASNPVQPTSAIAISDDVNVVPAVPAAATRGINRTAGSLYVPYILRTTNPNSVEIWIVNSVTGEVVANRAGLPGGNTSFDRNVIVGDFAVDYRITGGNPVAIRIFSETVEGVDASGAYTVRALAWNTGNSNFANTRVELSIVDNATGYEVAAHHTYMQGAGRFYVTFDGFTVFFNRGGRVVQNSLHTLPVIGDLEIVHVNPDENAFVPATGSVSGLDANGYFVAYVLPQGNQNNRRGYVWVLDAETREVVAQTNGTVGLGGANAALPVRVILDGFYLIVQAVPASGLVASVNFDGSRPRPERPAAPELPPVEFPEAEDEEYEYEEPTFVTPVHPIAPAPVIPVPSVPENVLPMPMPTVPVLPVEVEEEAYEEVEEEVYEEVVEEEVVLELPAFCENPTVWDAQTIYNNGDCVVHNGRTFLAQWWTQNDVPGTSPHGSWMEIEYVVHNGETIAVWTNSRVFNTGDRVLHDGNIFEAQWFSRNEVPGSTPWGAWMQLANTNNVESTVDVDPAHEVWTADRVFTGGETVYYDGNLWYAQWWTRNQRPGADQWGPWRNLGSA